MSWLKWRCEHIEVCGDPMTLTASMHRRILTYPIPTDGILYPVLSVKDGMLAAMVDTRDVNVRGRRRAIAIEGCCGP